MDILERRCSAPCGLAHLLDVLTDELDDRMESFAMAETLKYLLLTLDDTHWIHDIEDNL